MTFDLTYFESVATIGGFFLAIVVAILTFGKEKVFAAITCVCALCAIAFFVVGRNWTGDSGNNQFPKLADAQQYLSRGVSFRNAEQYELAHADFTAAIALEPKNWWSYFIRGHNLTRQENDSAAIADYTEAIRLSPKSSGPYVYRGIVLFRADEYDRAMADFAESLRLGASGSYRDLAYKYMVSIHNEREEWHKSIEIATKAIQAGCETYDLYFDRGLSYGRTDQWSAAISDLTMAIKHRPKSSYAFNNRGYYYSQIGEYEKAVRDFNCAIEINPKFRRAYVNRASCHNTLGNTEQAAKDSRMVQQLKK